MSDLFSLKNKVVLLTGAAGYLGSEMVKALLDHGATVYANTKTEKRFQELRKEISSDASAKLEKAIFDLNNKSKIDRFFNDLPKNEINVIVNNAYVGKSGGTNLSKCIDFDQAFKLSVTCPNYIFKKNLENNSSMKSCTSIINICSMYAHVAPRIKNYPNAKDVNPPFYGASKAALIQWTRYIATEFGNKGIRCNSISPGAFPKHASKSFEKKLVDCIPLGRLGNADEIAGCVIFLASDASSYINGEDIKIDGGWTSW